MLITGQLLKDTDMILIGPLNNSMRVCVINWKKLTLIASPATESSP